MVCGLFLVEWEEDSLVNKCSSSLQQISMSVTATMVAVSKPAPTQMVHSSAAVDLDLDWTVTARLAVVRYTTVPLTYINIHVFDNN